MSPLDEHKILPRRHRDAKKRKSFEIFGAIRVFAPLWRLKSDALAVTKMS